MKFSGEEDNDEYMLDVIFLCNLQSQRNFGVHLLLIKRRKLLNNSIICRNTSAERFKN